MKSWWHATRSVVLTGQKRSVTEQKWIWPVIVTGDYPKIISSPAEMTEMRQISIPYNALRRHNEIMMMLAIALPVWKTLLPFVLIKWRTLFCWLMVRQGNHCSGHEINFFGKEPSGSQIFQIGRQGQKVGRHLKKKIVEKTHHTVASNGRVFLALKWIFCATKKDISLHTIVT